MKSRGKDNKTQVWAHYGETESVWNNFRGTTQERKGDKAESRRDEDTEKGKIKQSNIH